MNVSGLDVIARSEDFEAAATRFELRPWQWHFLHALDGRAELRDVAATCGLDIDAATSFVEESEAAGLVHIVAMSIGDYRMWSGAQAAATAVAPETEDHFSTSDSLGGYATTVPSWMIAPAHHDEPAGNGQAEWAPDAPVAEVQHEEPLAEVHHDEPVAELHHEEPVAEVQHDEPVAEAVHDEWVPEFHQDAPVAEAHHDEPVAEAAHDEWVPEFHQDAPVAEWHHDEPVAEAAHDEWVPEFHHEEPVAEAAHDEWVPEFHQDAPAAEAHHEEPVAQGYAQAWSTYSHETDAAKAVADLVGTHDADHAAPEVGRAPVSLSFGEPEPSTFASVGHSYDSTWEPMSLVTAVDPGPMPDEYSHDAAPHHEPAHDDYAEPHHEPAHDDLGGISISLGASPATTEPEAYDHGPVPEAGPSRGISFSLSPDIAAPWNDVVAATHDEVPAAESHDDAPVAEHHEPVAAAASEAAAEAAATNGHIENEPATQPAATSSTTADIVGNLIARALTFRIK
jgi:hypothetical protein